MSFVEQCKIKILNIRGGDIPDEQYFKIKGISNSKLKLINPLEGGSPDLYLKGFQYSYNPFLECGTFTHCMILQPQDYELTDYEGKPSGKCGYFIDKLFEYRQKGLGMTESVEKASKAADYYDGKMTPKILRKALLAGREYYKKLKNNEFVSDSGKTVLVGCKKNLDIAKACIDSINKNMDIQRILQQTAFNDKEYYNEIAIFMDIEVTFPDGIKTIIPFKGKLDSVVIDNARKIVYLNDLKTTSSQIDFFMDKIIDGEVYNGSFSKHHYWRQLAVYLIGLKKYVTEILHKEDYIYESNIFAVETCSNHLSRKFPINQGYIDAGIKEFKDLICRVAFHDLYGYDKQFPDTNV